MSSPDEPMDSSDRDSSDGDTDGESGVEVELSGETVSQDRKRVAAERLAGSEDGVVSRQQTPRLESGARDGTPSSENPDAVSSPTPQQPSEPSLDEPGPSIDAPDGEDSTEMEPGIEAHQGADAMASAGEPREYIQIIPVREEISPETMVRELYGLHAFGMGRTLPFKLEDRIDAIEQLYTFEFLIHKPADKQRFNFYLSLRPEEELDHLDSKVRSQYPSDYQFERQHFDVSDRFDETPHICRWHGREQKRKDWMCLLTEYGEDAVERSPLSNLLETAIRTDEEWVFSAVFEPRPDFTNKATRHKRNLKMGVHTMAGAAVQQFLDRIVGVSQWEQRQRHRGETPEEVGGSLSDTEGEGSRYKTNRMSQIDIKQPDSCFNLTVRCASPDEKVIRDMTSAFGSLSGSFYEVRGEYIGQDEAEFKRLLRGEITFPTGKETVWKDKPMLVVNPEELANFITVPTIDSLPKASRGASGGGPAARSPLTSPDEEVFEAFSEGQCIGQAVTVADEEGREERIRDPLESVTEWRTEIRKRESILLGATDLTQHALRAGTTSSGKTVATINDVLTAAENLSGPIVLIDPKGGDMCENYLRSHRYIFGDLENVEYIKIPGDNGEVPGLPFFDLRPLIYQGNRSRETAIQDIIDHLMEILGYILGEDTLEQAFVANEILTHLIKTLFEEERAQYPDPDEAAIGEKACPGGDAFPISQLMDYALKYQDVDVWKTEADTDDGEEGPRLPFEVENDETRAVLERQFRKNQRQFANTTDAVLNRITKLKERDFIWRMLDYKPEWDEDRQWYAKDENVLDLREILHSNKVILVDTGELRQESRQIFSVLFLSHLWTALTSLHTPDKDDYVANVVIEESAPLGRSELVYDELLPQGREFDLSMELVMQYPEQVLGDNPNTNMKAYKEVLNNINTKIIGNVNTDDLLAESLFHEALDAEQIKDRISGLPRGEFIVQLPPTGFQKQKPEILTLKPLPIPPGHAESPDRIRPLDVGTRKESRQKYCMNPSDTADRVDSVLESGPTDSPRADAPDLPAEADKPPEALSDRERAFLRDVIEYWNGDLEFHSTGDPMNNRQFDRRMLAPDLIDNGYLDSEQLAGRYTYYWPTDKTLDMFDDLHIERGPDQGDPNESARHKAVTALLRRLYEERGFDVRTYFGDDEANDPTFDIIATHPTKSARVIEVETSRRDRENTPLRRQGVVDDYKKLANYVEEANGHASAIWVVENHHAAHHLLDILEDEGHIEERPSRDVQGYQEITSQLSGGSGIDKINGFGIVLDKVLGEGFYSDDSDG